MNKKIFEISKIFFTVLTIQEPPNFFYQKILHKGLYNNQEKS
jgi:hypothetical protein